jgi:hypothetical protein
VIHDRVIHDRLPNEHFVETRHTYYARCSCGWTSPTLESVQAASDYFRLHLVVHAKAEAGA